MILLFIALASFIGFTPSVKGLNPISATVEMSLMEMTAGDNVGSYATSLEGRYEASASTAELYGRYLRVEVDNDDFARNWLAGFRFDHNLLERQTRIYFLYQIESDPFGGIVQRNSQELGVYQVLSGNATDLWTVDVGYRYMQLIPEQFDKRYQTGARVGTQYEHRLTARVTLDVTGEYIFNFSDTGMDLVNAQAGLGSSLTPALFLKLSYLVQYQRQPFGDANDTSTFTTLNMVAKF